MKLFSVINSTVKTDGYYITGFPDIKVYSEKSFNRESRLLISLLSEAYSNKKSLIWISPFHKKILDYIPEDYKKNLIWIAPISFSQMEFSDSPMIINNESKLNFFLNDIKKNDSFVIKIHQSLLTYKFDSIIQEYFLKTASRLKTIDHFGKIWENNFRINQRFWKELPDIKHLTIHCPDLFLLGGPSIDNAYNNIKKSNHIWCADTSLPLLAHFGISPDLIFSLDAGYGSYEHFIYAFEKNILENSIAVLDPLSFPLIFKIPFKRIFTYANSNPMIQSSSHQFTFLENHSNDVFGLMKSVFNLLIKERLPNIIGFDRGHIKKVTHYKGSAYHKRQYGVCNRFITPEKYFFQLSNRYSQF